MSKSPLIISAALHLAILLMIGFFAGARRPPVSPVSLPYIDLASMPFTDLAAAPQVPPQVITPPADKKISASVPRPAPAASGEEEIEQPAAQQAVPAANPQGLEISRAFAVAAHMQAMAYNTRSYFNSTEKAVKKLLEGKLLSDERRKFDGEHASVSATYGAGELVLLSVASDNQELGQALNDAAAWAKVPSPDRFSLSFNKVTFQVSLEKGRINIGISPQ